jgi:hypothetical protein
MEEEMRAAGLIPGDIDERWAEVDSRAIWKLPRAGRSLWRRRARHGDYRDLRRSAQRVELDEHTRVAVAHPRDLLRIADASLRGSERERAPGLRALLDRVTET